MSHDVNIVQTVLATLIFILAGSVTLALYIRRRKTGIKALNLLIYIFLALALLGLTEVIQNLWHQYFFIFPVSDKNVPFFYSPVRVVNLMAIILLYFFAENILEAKSNITRFSFMISMISGMFFISIISHNLDIVITTNMLIPFANGTRLDEFLFDILQLYISSFVGYMFYEQFKFIESKEYRNYILLFLAASILTIISMTHEVLEHLLPIRDLNAFITTFPTILLLAYIYLRHPNLIYLVPTEVRFLQLVSVDAGIPVYVAEFDGEQKMDFLIGPGLSSIRTMLRELLEVNKENKDGFSLKSFEYNNGFLIFEESTGLFALLQADRLSRVLLTSLAYFITEFERLFGDQIIKFKGKIDPVNGISPDDLLRRCVPIVQAKPIISSIDKAINLE